MLERGTIVSYETIRCWAKKFGPDYAARSRRKPPSLNDIWHLDEVVVMIGGRKHWLWRAVDQDGYVLDEIVQARRNTKAAKRLLIRLMKKQGCQPKRIVTDKLRSYGAALRQLMPTIEHRSHKGLNNRAENSHLPLRKRAGDAAISLARRTATFRQHLLHRSKSLRPSTISALSFRHPSASPCSGGPLEGCRRNCRLVTPQHARSVAVALNLTSPLCRLFLGSGCESSL